ncbi:MAG: hypothetical protein K940chlam2_00539 [Chlamydiae bacterium]|nr:hypothetical protein [Chlamydiota bacterium]
MGSFKPNKILDVVRGCFVAATPEEIVRQSLLLEMIRTLGYPKELLAVEKQLSELPHLMGVERLPKRRTDIVCYARGIHPLLLIECKEGDVGKEAIQQALGYNAFVGAPFVAVAGKRGCALVFPESKSFLPHYKELLLSANY